MGLGAQETTSAPKPRSANIDDARRLIGWKLLMKLHSYTITQGRDRAPARAMLKAIGFSDEDLRKPIIGVANTWIETMPCNYNLRELAVHVKEGIRQAGGTPMEFNTIAISDGVTMGTEGMKASL